MKNKKYGFSEIDATFESNIVAAIDDMRFTTSKRIVEERIVSLAEQIDILKSYKYQAIKRGSEYEHEANCFLYMQCVTQAVRSVFVVFSYLREDENQKAWHSLIDAYEYLEVAQRAASVLSDGPLSENSGLHSIQKRIRDIEEGIFPPHGLYNSPGIIETIGECSVCQRGFLECDHVEGNIYSGIYCMRVNRVPMDFEHFAMVKEPRDRRCIFVTRPNSQGQMSDIFSREPIEDMKEENVYRAILFNLGGLDVN